MEKNFSMLAYTEQQKVAFTTYMLEADIEFWWLSPKRLLENAQTIITQGVFKDAFYQKYFLASVKNSKELKFMKLQQGSMSVSKYIAKFKELYKFYTIYQRNLDKVWKCIQYEGGLREEILTSMGPLEIRDYTTLINKSRLVEYYNKKLAIAQATRDTTKKRQVSQDQGFKDAPYPMKQFQPTGRMGEQLQKQLVSCRCPKYGRDHGDKPSRVGQNICFNYGKLGPMKRECPTKDQQLAARPQYQGRDFTLSIEEVAQPENMIRGSKALTVWQDFGAMHSSFFQLYSQDQNCLCSNCLMTCLSLLPLANLLELAWLRKQVCLQQINFEGKFFLKG